jgi:hypothetical protein
VTALPGVPDIIDVAVPCTGNNTVCGFNGECRVDICKCDKGWSSPTLAAPCSAKGPSQLKMAVLQYFTGWFGLPLFLLGWNALGIATVGCLVLMCCSVCTYTVAEDSLPSVADNTADAASRKKKYERRQMCAASVGICSCCAWFWLWIVFSVLLSLTAYCATWDGTGCTPW